MTKFLNEHGNIGFPLAIGEPPCDWHSEVSPLPLLRFPLYKRVPVSIYIYSTPATLWARRLDAAAAIAPTISSRKV